MGVNQFSRKWCRLKTYGGKLAENITQAAARDVLAYNMRQIDGIGNAIVLTVHDEIIAETPDQAEYMHTELAAMMAIVPIWSPGLPLAAAGYETYRYRKG
jgi:DNA polymerase